MLRSPVFLRASVKRVLCFALLAAGLQKQRRPPRIAKGGALFRYSSSGISRIMSLNGMQISSHSIAR